MTGVHRGGASVTGIRNPRGGWTGGRTFMSDRCGTLRVGVLSESIEDEGGRWTWALSVAARGACSALEVGGGLER
ncbi:MAG: hypothetical protein CMJ34_00075 [Phycisphaerae bacterium]|nr:hypothetical protein [Phycisphaerae bacterium]